MSETVTRWWWIRHAPVTTDQGCFYGQQDLPADTTINADVYGALAAALPKNAIWVASHLQRTHQTAQAIGAAGYPLPNIGYYEDLAEQHFGDWQGKPRAPVHKQYGSIHGFWMTLLDERPRNGESFRDLRSRVDNVVDHLSAEHRGGDIVAVAHGGTIRAAIARALDLPGRMALNFTIGNSSLTRLALIEGPDRSAYWNITLLNGYGVS
ncbi:MAG: histidine phosphatase family protein [Rhodospirillaceae bacterium]|nr:histidine phosphatase family protein [Rhodospirillaceae bacterium]MCY4309787.1 histidine phosphatase family protein [Rhodospirillaceae bacterium]